MPPMPDLYKKGVNIAIGCDGESSSGIYDILKEARLVSLLGKVRTMEADMFPAEVIYEMLTRNGKKCIGFETTVGELKPGHKADFAAIDYMTAHLIDERRLMSDLIFSATAGDVAVTFVDGEPLMWEKKSTKIDEEMVMQKVLETMHKTDHIFLN
jgi:5-methylthioadenosine/S-adenosylhomocysteine deaminase